MHPFLIICKCEGKEEYHIINAWDKKEAIVNFYDEVRSDYQMSRRMFEKIVKALSIGETVAVFNEIEGIRKITDIYENLCRVDISSDLYEELDDGEKDRSQD